jgi:hypothetical protein
VRPRGRRDRRGRGGLAAVGPCHRQLRHREEVPQGGVGVVPPGGQPLHLRHLRPAQHTRHRPTVTSGCGRPARPRPPVPTCQSSQARLSARALSTPSTSSRISGWRVPRRGRRCGRCWSVRAVISPSSSVGDRARIPRTAVVRPLMSAVVPRRQRRRKRMTPPARAGTSSD